MIRKFLIVLITAISLTGCAAKARMAEKRDPVFALQFKSIVERDLTEPYSVKP